MSVGLLCWPVWAVGSLLPSALYLNMGSVLLADEKPDAAVRAINTAVERSGNVSLLVQAGKLFQQGGADALAQVQFERALQNQPGDIKLIRANANLLEGMGSVERARQLYWSGMQQLLSREQDRTEAIAPKSGESRVKLSQRDMLLRSYLEDRNALALDGTKVQANASSQGDELRPDDQRRTAVTAADRRSAEAGSGSRRGRRRAARCRPSWRRVAQ